MTKSKRIPGPVMVLVLLLPVVGIVAWLLYDSPPQSHGTKSGSRVVAEGDGAQLSILVTAAGKPVEGAMVVGLSHSAKRSVWSPRTDAEGRTQLEDLAPGKTTVAVLLKGYKRAKTEIVAKPRGKQQVEIKLERDDGTTGSAPSTSARSPQVDDQAVLAEHAKGTRPEPARKAAPPATP